MYTQLETCANSISRCEKPTRIKIDEPIHDLAFHTWIFSSHRLICVIIVWIDLCKRHSPLSFFSVCWAVVVVVAVVAEEPKSPAAPVLLVLASDSIAFDLTTPWLLLGLATIMVNKPSALLRALAAYEDHTKRSIRAYIRFWGEKKLIHEMVSNIWLIVKTEQKKLKEKLVFCLSRFQWQ